MISVFQMNEEKEDFKNLCPFKTFIKKGLPKDWKVR